MPRVHLVDALPYVFRAYFSIPSSVKAPDGAPKNAVYGFATFLLKLLQDERVTHAAVAFDESLNSSFRNEMLAGYKSSRELPPPELEAQLKDCQELSRALGIFTVASERYEADDLIATLARGACRDAASVVIVTSDKDLAQLVTDCVSVLDFGKGERLGPDQVRAKMGVPPELVPDLLALMGDAVDDIPGVPGIGAKTAAALVSALGRVDQVYERLDEIAALPIRGAASVRAKLEAHRDQAMLSKRLALVADDAPITATIADLALQPVDAARIDALCERLAFGRMRERLLARFTAAA